MPWGRELSNPFYYSGLTREVERDELYRRLLGRFAKEATETVFLEQDSERAELAAGVSGRIEWAHTWVPKHFPYVRPHAHLSEVGNDWMAQAYLAILLGRPDIAAEELVLTDAPFSGRVEQCLRESLSAYDRVGISIGSQPAGAVVHLGSLGTSISDDLVDPSKEGIRALLSLTKPGGSFLDALAAPLDFDIEPGARIELEATSGAPSRVWELGRIILANAHVQVGYGKIPGVEIKDPWGDREGMLCLDGAAFTIPPSVRGVVRVGGHPAFAVAPGGDGCALRLIPVGRPFVRVEPLGNTKIEMSALASGGNVFLDLPGRAESLTIGTFQRQSTRIRYSSTGARQVIRAEGSVGRLESQP